MVGCPLCRVQVFSYTGVKFSGVGKKLTQLIFQTMFNAIKVWGRIYTWAQNGPKVVHEKPF
jgi:hypothetical protein